MINKQTRTRGRLERSGSIYVLVLMTSLIVAIIGLSSVAVSRIELRRNASMSNAAAARAAARAGVEYALYKVRSETTWSNLQTGSATWATNVPFQGGTYSIARTAYDNTDPLNPRLTVLSVGTHADAVYKLRVQIVAGSRIESTGWAQVVD